MSVEFETTESNPVPSYVYDAEGGTSNWRSKVSELWQYRYLLRNLVVRDLKARYKNSVFGVLWSLLNPLAMMLVFTLLFSVMGNDNTRQYPVFVLVGLIPWMFFTGSLTSGTTSVTGNSCSSRRFISRVNCCRFPHCFQTSSILRSPLWC